MKLKLHNGRSTIRRGVDAEAAVEGNFGLRLHLPVCRDCSPRTVCCCGRPIGVSRPVTPLSQTRRGAAFRSRPEGTQRKLRWPSLASAEICSPLDRIDHKPLAQPTQAQKRRLVKRARVCRSLPTSARSMKTAQNNNNGRNTHRMSSPQQRSLVGWPFRPGPEVVARQK